MFDLNSIYNKMTIEILHCNIYWLRNEDSFHLHSLKIEMNIDLGSDTTYATTSYNFARCHMDGVFNEFRNCQYPIGLNAINDNTKFTRFCYNLSLTVHFQKASRKEPYSCLVFTRTQKSKLSSKEYCTNNINGRSLTSFIGNFLY